MKHTKQLSRQRQSQIRYEKAGLCSRCGKPRDRDRKCCFRCGIINGNRLLGFGEGKQALLKHRDLFERTLKSHQARVTYSVGRIEHIEDNLDKLDELIRKSS